MVATQTDRDACGEALTMSDHHPFSIRSSRSVQPPARPFDAAPPDRRRLRPIRRRAPARCRFRPPRPAGSDRPLSPITVFFGSYVFAGIAAVLLATRSLCWWRFRTFAHRPVHRPCRGVRRGCRICRVTGPV